MHSFIIELHSLVISNKFSNLINRLMIRKNLLSASRLHCSASGNLSFALGNLLPVNRNRFLATEQNRHSTQLCSSTMHFYANSRNQNNSMCNEHYLFIKK